MRIPLHVLAAGVLLAAVSASVWASEQPPIAEQSPLAPLPSRPMQQQGAQAAVGRYQQLHPVQQPIVICGLTLLHADPKSDANIRVRPPSAGVNPMIGRVTPQVCRGAGTSQPALPQTPR